MSDYVDSLKKLQMYIQKERHDRLKQILFHFLDLLFHAELSLSAYVNS